MTYTDPELAHVGMTEATARERMGEIRVLRFPFAENDRAWAERATDGFVKVVASRKGAVLGASIVGAHAGELIQTWILPVARAMHVKHVAGLIMPYPTLGEANKRAAGSYFTPTLFGPPGEAHGAPPGPARMIAGLPRSRAFCPSRECRIVGACPRPMVEAPAP